MLSLLEVPVAFLHERLRRVTATLITVGLLALIGATAARSRSLLADVKVAGMTPFDLFDFATSNVLLPLGGLLLCLFVGWSWGYREFMESLAAGSTPRRAVVHRACFIAIKFLTPVLVLLVLLNGLNLL
jgi:neurotransmitter:Na+ symporter, NSS family